MTILLKERHICWSFRPEDSSSPGLLDVRLLLFPFWGPVVSGVECVTPVHTLGMNTAGCSDQHNQGTTPLPTPAETETAKCHMDFNNVEGPILFFPLQLVRLSSLSPFRIPLLLHFSMLLLPPSTFSLPLPLHVNNPHLIVSPCWPQFCQM